MMVQEEALRKSFPVYYWEVLPIFSDKKINEALPISSKPSLTVHTVFIFGTYLRLDSFGGLIVLL